MNLIATETARETIERERNDFPVLVDDGHCLRCVPLLRIIINRKRTTFAECYFLDLFDKRKDKQAEKAYRVLKALGIGFRRVGEDTDITAYSEELKFRIAVDKENQWNLFLHDVKIGRVEGYLCWGQ